MHPTEPPFLRLQFYLTSAYPCSYVPGLTARSQVATPAHLVNREVYSLLIRNGFRRSCQFTYRPQCDGCQACIPVRVRAGEFAMRRSQRRVWTRNGDLRTIPLPLDFHEEHYALYRRYQRERHAGGGMDQDGVEQYSQFLLQSHADSCLVEFRRGRELVMVSVMDRVEDGLSAVYTFYEPGSRDSLGTYNVIWQIERARELGLPYVYLGYWIAQSRKMAYKIRFQPLEGLLDQVWQTLPPAPHSSAD